MPQEKEQKKCRVYKVEKYAMSPIRLHAVWTEKERLIAKPVKFFLPASKEEYETYNSQKK